MAPSRSAVRSSSSRAPGTSRAMTRAPSRASTEATAAPMPRAAPVTRAVRPVRGAAGSATGSGAAPESGAVEVSSMTWPLTWAERGESRKRRVDPAAWAFAPPGIRTSWAGEPRPISLPSDRTNPSNACWAAAWWWSSGDGTVPRTTIRPPGARERTTGCRAAWTSPSPAAVATPVASRTIAAGRSVRLATGSPEALRVSATPMTAGVPAVRCSSGPSRCGVSRVQRRSGAGCGRPRRRVRKRPGAVPVRCR
ncbi:hypothetical protein SCYAM73S_06720 [Streptomyces cyaneofuscatus]